MKNIFTILQSYKETKMTSTEKQDLWNNISKATFDMPINEAVRNPVPSRLYGIGLLPSKFFTTKKRTATALIGGMVFLGGVAAYAQETIPGDFLYPIKTSVIEKAMIFATVSPESKAKLSIKLTNERLIETEKLAIKGKLNDKNKSELDNSLNLTTNNFISSLNNLRSSGKTEVVNNLSKEFQTSIAVHAAVISSLSLNSNDKSLVLPLGKNADEINKYLFSYANSINQVEKDNGNKVTLTSNKLDNEEEGYSTTLNIDSSKGEDYLKEIKNEIGIPETIEIVIKTKIDINPIIKPIPGIKLNVLKNTNTVNSTTSTKTKETTATSSSTNSSSSSTTTINPTTENVVPVVIDVSNPVSPVEQVVQPVTEIITPIIPVVPQILPLP